MTKKSLELLPKFVELLRVDPKSEIAGTRVQARLVGIGLSCTCGRCGGTGSFSYCQQYGTTCFGCGGSGKVAQKLTAKLLAEASKRVAAGALDDYFARCKAKKDALALVSKHDIEPLALRMKYTDNTPETRDSWTGMALDYINLRGRLVGDLKDAGSKLRAAKTDEARASALKDVVAFSEMIADLEAVTLAKATTHPEFCAARLYRPFDPIWAPHFSRRFLVSLRCKSFSELQNIGARDLADAIAYARRAHHWGDLADLVTELA